MTSDHSAASMTVDHAADIDRHVRVYITVFVALMALTLITVAISYLHLSTPMAIAVALLVATIKGSLVACYFMHLIAEKKLIYVVLADHRGHVHRAAGASRHHPRQRLLDSRMNLQVGPRGADSPVRCPRGAVRGLVPGAVPAGERDREPGRRPSRRSPFRLVWSSTTRGSCARRGCCDEPPSHFHLRASRYGGQVAARRARPAWSGYGGIRGDRWRMRSCWPARCASGQRKPR